MPNHESRGPKQLPEELQPTQDQLKKLSDTILQHEPQVSPFDGLPSKAVLDEFDTDLDDFEILAGPPSYDETLAPAQTLRTTDRRVVWLSVFRNPDTNEPIQLHIMVIDPPINRSERPEVPKEDYDLGGTMGKYAIEHFNSPPMTGTEVDALQELIDSAEPFNAFLEI